MLKPCSCPTCWYKHYRTGKALNDKKLFVVNFSIRGKDGYTQSNVTWYDARKKHPTRTKYRLYFRTNGVMSQAKEGSTLIFGLDSKNNFWAELII